MFMVLVILMAVLLLACFAMRRHGGIVFLASIAGMYIFNEFGQIFTDFICNLIPAVDEWWCLRCINLLFVLVFPMIIYFRASKGGLFGVLRLVETVAFAFLITVLVAPTLAEIFEFDDLAQLITQGIEVIRTPMIIIGIILSYVDILVAKKT